MTLSKEEDIQPRPISAPSNTTTPSNTTAETPESRLVEALKTYPANIQDVWTVLDAMKNSSASARTTTHDSSDTTRRDGASTSSDDTPAEEKRQDRIKDACCLLDTAIESVEEMRDVLQLLRAQLVETSSDIVNNEESRAAIKPNPHAASEGSADRDEGATRDEKRALHPEIFDAARRIRTTGGDLTKELFDELSASPSAYDDAQKERILRAWDRFERGIESLFHAALHDVRYALAGHGCHEPPPFHRRLSLPSMSQHDGPADHYVPYAPVGGQQGQLFTPVLLRAGNSAPWTSVESSPTHFPGFTTIGLLMPVPQRSGDARIYVPAGNATSADLPPVFMGSESETSHSDTNSLRPTVSEDIDSHSWQSQTMDRQAPPPSAEHAAEADLRNAIGPPDDSTAGSENEPAANTSTSAGRLTPRPVQHAWPF